MHTATLRRLALTALLALLLLLPAAAAAAPLVAPPRPLPAATLTPPPPAPARAALHTLLLPLALRAAGATPPVQVTPQDGHWTGYPQAGQPYYLKFDVQDGGLLLDFNEIYISFNGQCQMHDMRYALANLPPTAIQDGQFSFISQSPAFYLHVTGAFHTPTTASGAYRLTATRPATVTPTVTPPCSYTATGTWHATYP